MDSDKNIEDTEEEIRRYYRRIIEIKKLKHRLAFLESKRTQVEKDIENSRIRLNVVMPGSALDKEFIQNNGPISSQQERALENAFSKLERQLEKINDDIIDVNIDMRDLESQNCDMEFVFTRLDPTAMSFVQLYYEKRIGYVKISNELHLSTATIGRLRLKILDDVMGHFSSVKKT